MEQLKRDLRSTALYAADEPTTDDELEIYVREYNTALSSILDKHALVLGTRTRVSRPVVPWYSDTIDKAKRHCHVGRLKGSGEEQSCLQILLTTKRRETMLLT